MSTRKTDADDSGRFNKSFPPIVTLKRLIPDKPSVKWELSAGRQNVNRGTNLNGQTGTFRPAENSARQFTLAATMEGQASQNGGWTHTIDLS
jgi:hypothetical protein